MNLADIYVSTSSPYCMLYLWPQPTFHGLLTLKKFRLIYVKHLCLSLFRVALRVTVMIFG